MAAAGHQRMPAPAAAAAAWPAQYGGGRAPLLVCWRRPAVRLLRHGAAVEDGQGVRKRCEARLHMHAVRPHSLLCAGMEDG